MTIPHTFTGIAAAPGIAIGPALIYHFEEESGDRAEAAGPEIARLDNAIAAADTAIAATEATLREAGKADEADIFTAHRILLTDPSLRERAVALISEEGFTAAGAIGRAGEEQAAELLAIDDPYFSARATDVRDVVGQVRRLLTGAATLGARLTGPAVIVAEDLGPSDLMSVPRNYLLGFALAGGGLTAHATILARSLEIPAVIGLGPALLDTVTDGVPLALDGTAGTLELHPNPQRLAALHGAVAAIAARRTDMQARRDQPAITRDGHEVVLEANVASADEARSAQEWGADGVGLLRTELLFLERPTLPSEEEQLGLYRGVAAALPGKPIVVRTLDVGGDKRLPALALPREANPFLGWRGLRIGLDRPETLLPQLRALLRAGAEADIRIMFPMVTTLAEVRRARAFVEQARADLVAAGLPCAEHPLVGIMVEVPSAALNADILAQEVDFFSIGTNDLTQYTLAVERTNPHVAQLYQPLDPAVLRLIAMTAEAAHRYGRRVAICGEMASDPQLTMLLIGLGVDELSCSPPAIPLVRDAIRAADQNAARELARNALAATGADEVRKLLSSA